jgi:Trk-type K+ transport system membrane component
MEDPPVDAPVAIEQAYRFHRAKRRAQIERRRRTRHAQLRFYFVLAALTILTLAVALFVWNQVQRLFGL